MFKLKDYQSRALDVLEDFARRLQGGQQAAPAAWAVAIAAQGVERVPAYDGSTMGEVPAVCLRIPTGGGKTTLAAHGVARVGRALSGTEAPVVLWLVPSDAIRTQTLVALRTVGNPCHEALAQHFGDRVRVCALDELATVGPHEVGTAAVLVVATIQSFNVKDTSQRNVYSFDESLAPHFQNLAPAEAQRLERVTEADVQAQTYLSSSDVGRVKASLANWLALHRPIVVVDEAHNNRTDQAFRTLRRLSPACVVELTATPVKGSNVLFHVGAQALQREEMVKLPIVLMEHPTGWKDAVRDAILTRDRLETLAASDADYLRPVLLFQAQPKGGEATVEALLAHLTSADGEKLPREQIAVATGEQKELDGVVISDPLCPIRYVITVEALKEGWDCPFAYVLCSLQEARSAKDVEQLLGRILRMPYARSRGQAELNKAYAHIVSAEFGRVATALTDRLVDNMGFEPYEAVQAIVPAQLPLPGQEGCGTSTPGSASPKPADAIIPLPAMPDQPLPPHMADVLELRPTTGGATAIVRGGITDAVEDFLLTGFSGKQQVTVKTAIDRERDRQAALLAPASRGVPFAPLPQLCLLLEGEPHPVDRGLLSELGHFDLFTEPVTLAGFAVHEQGSAWEIDVDGDQGTVQYRVAEPEQLYLNTVPAHASENDLVRWLDRECRQVDVSQPQMLRWLLALVQHLQRDRGLTLTALVRMKYPLAEAVRREIERRKQKAIVAGFQQALPGLAAAPTLADGFRHAFVFHPDRYPARPPFYQGRFRFQKHYYAVIHDLREKTASGAPAEEFLCAQAIDNCKQVKHWVRNVEREQKFSFWLPTSTDYFYPDFVAELTDGRLLVVEYKGKAFLNADTHEKQQIGHQWEATSGGRWLFLLALAEDDQGRNVSQQIAHKIGA